mmetsp:Transcript_22893/g.17342  ORF Transcript_22893/g.17342 Transcript_22893/m.17342 type:complete len:134 (-) Transcript_22893:239-640(-)
MGIHYSQVGTRQYQAPEVLERRFYRGDYVDIFSIGVILFVMVTGTLPYLKEASIKDPLYKLIFLKKQDEFWSFWRSLNGNDEEIEDESTCQKVRTFLSSGVNKIFLQNNHAGEEMKRQEEVVQSCKRHYTPEF